MIKTNSKTLTKLVNSRKLSPFRKDLKKITITYDKNSKIRYTHYNDFFRKIIFLKKEDMTPLILIHELTHFKDYTQNNKIILTPDSKGMGMHMCMYITNKESKTINQALYNKMSKTTILTILDKILTKDYFKRYKYKENCESFMVDIFNSITGGKYARDLYWGRVSHNKEYYYSIYPRLFETNANFTALTYICGKDKIRSVFKDLGQLETYKKINKLHTVIKGGYKNE